ncbi:MAG: CPBP family intramembrane metalloprotease [Chitinophagaceae bacterium]
MKAELHKKPLIPAGWLRALLFIIFYFAISISAGIIISAITAKNIAALNSENNKSSLFYLVTFINAALGVLIVWLFRKIIDRRSFESLGFGIAKNGSHAATGFFLGIFLLCLGSCILFFTKNLVWTDINFNGSDLFIGFGLMLMSAFSEEIICRGYILNNLLDSMGKWPALILSALLFALAHFANPDFSVIAAVNIFLAGLLLGLNYIYTRNLWFGIALHFSWNFFQGPILGYEVSGIPLKSLLEHDVQGSVLLTGGKFGFEGSLLASVLLALSIAALLWVYESKFRPVASIENEQAPAAA